MVSEKQRNFNQFITEYIEKLPEKKPLDTKLDERIERLEENQLEEAEEEDKDRGFFSRVFKFLFVNEQRVAEQVDEPEDTPITKVVVKAERRDVLKLLSIIETIIDSLDDSKKKRFMKSKSYQDFKKVRDRYLQ